MAGLSRFKSPRRERGDELTRIAEGVRRGEHQALEQLYAKLGPMVFGFLVRTLPDRGTAEDVQQQVFVEVWRRAAQYDPARASLATWVMTIARSRAIDELRRNRPTPHDPATLPEAPTSDGVDALAEEWCFAGLLASINPEDATLLKMRFYEDLTQEQISERTGIPLGTVKSRMVRGLDKLRELLGDDDLSGEAGWLPQPRLGRTALEAA